MDMALNAAIGVNASGMDTSKQTIDTLVQELSDVLKEMEDNTQTMLEGWIGDSADAFAKASYSLGLTLSNIMLDLQEAGNHMAGTKTQMLDTDELLSNGIAAKGEK